MNYKITAFVIISLLVLFSTSCVRRGEVYQNPLLANTPDPCIIRGGDGYFYNTTGSRINRSRDLLSWESMGSVLDSLPELIGYECQMWASSLNHIDDKYVCYYGIVPWERTDSAVLGVAVADSPTGPFTDLGIVMDGTGKVPFKCIEPCFFQNPDGSRWLIFKSYEMIGAIELEHNGLTIKEGAEPIRFGTPDFFAPYVYYHEGLYYIIMSRGACCEEESSTYHLVVARSSNLRGPYLNRAGEQLLDGAYDVLLQGNDQFIGPGHTSQWMTDDNGDTWLMYHSWVAGQIPEMNRALMLDKVTWTEDGWPVINDGTPSTEPHPGPYFHTH